jgi:hypothetical protein
MICSSFGIGEILVGHRASGYFGHGSWTVRRRAARLRDCSRDPWDRILRPFDRGALDRGENRGNVIAGSFHPFSDERPSFGFSDAEADKQARTFAPQLMFYVTVDDDGRRPVRCDSI